MGKLSLDDDASAGPQNSVLVNLSRPQSWEDGTRIDRNSGWRHKSSRTAVLIAIQITADFMAEQRQASLAIWNFKQCPSYHLPVGTAVVIVLPRLFLLSSHGPDHSLQWLRQQFIVVSSARPPRLFFFFLTLSDPNTRRARRRLFPRRASVVISSGAGAPAASRSTPSTDLFLSKFGDLHCPLDGVEADKKSQHNQTAANYLLRTRHN